MRRFQHNKDNYIVLWKIHSNRNKKCEQIETCKFLKDDSMSNEEYKVHKSLIIQLWIREFRLVTRINYLAGGTIFV